MSDARDFWNWVLITVGGLMTALCGGCTLWWLGIGLNEIGAEGDAGTYAAMIAIAALIVGGLPTLMGAILLVIGLRRRR